MPPLRANHGFPSKIGLLFAIALSLPRLAAEYLQKNITDVTGYKLAPGVHSVPAPVRVAPDQDWTGIDGSWNTFSLFVGEPRQNVRVLVSTASQQIWAISRLACVSNITSPIVGQVMQQNVLNPQCENSRGFLFNVTESLTWAEKGYYQLWVEKAIGLAGNGLYGFDTVAMGFPGEEGPSTMNSTIGTLVSSNFWLGHIGVHHKPTNFSASEAPIPSYMMNLFDQGSIPSKSFGYTAGAQYHGRMVLGSLTLGGYDASRFVTNDLSFIFEPDNERDLVVGVVGLSANTTTQFNIDLLMRSELNMFIDSTVAELWLPPKVCQAFEDALGLEYDARTDLYLVNDSLHAKLLAQNPSITFTLGQQYRTDSTVQITLPYAALDLVASPPYRGLQEQTRYFPIRRGYMANQWILGRTFLQEAYLTVDWERQNFSVSAIDWTFGNSIDLRPIVDTKYLEQGPDLSEMPELSSRAIIGISTGLGLVVIVILFAIGLCVWRRRRYKLEARTSQDKATVMVAASKKASIKSWEGSPTSAHSEDEKSTTVFPKAELPGISTLCHELSNREKESSLAIHEIDSIECPVYEMPAGVPAPQEAGGRQLSEKEILMVREQIYNGVDASHPPVVSPNLEDTRPRPALVSPAEVTTLHGGLTSHSTVSPIMPRRPRDGALLEASDTYFLSAAHPLRGYRRTETEDGLLSPLSGMEESTEESRQRFSYES